MADIAVKNIAYTYDKNNSYEMTRNVAVKEISQQYQEEVDFQKDEYNQMLADGDVADMDEYKAYLDLSPEDVDYSLPFEQNQNHPRIQAEIENLTQKYMANVYDLPRMAVVQIPDSEIDSKGRPDKYAVMEALREKFDKNGVHIQNYDFAGTAEKKDLLTQQAYESVSEMMQSKEYQQFLSLRASIQKYSSKNIALIYSQKPDAKAVMGYNAWQKLDRQVPKGSHGIAIWQPCQSEKKSEKAIDEYIEKQKALYPNYYVVNSDGSCPNADKKKEELMKELQENGVAIADTGFKLGTVFDVSQTIPKDPANDNIQDIINLNKPLQDNLANYDDVIRSMREAATILLLSVSTDNNKSEQERMFEALLNYAEKVFKECPDKVVGIKSDTPLTGDMHKIETVMTAYMISEHIGIDTADKAALMLAEIFDKDFTEQAVTVGKREMFMKGFDRAAKLSDMFTRAFDKSFGIDIEAQREAVAKKVEEAKVAKEAAKKVYNATHTYFGVTPMLIADQWETNNTSYTIGQNEKTGTYFIRTTTNKKDEYIRNDEGKPMKFKEKPDRDTCEVLLANQIADKKAKEATPSPAPTDKDDKPDSKPVGIDM